MRFQCFWLFPCGFPTPHRFGCDIRYYVLACSLEPRPKFGFQASACVRPESCPHYAKVLLCESPPHPQAELATIMDLSPQLLQGANELLQAIKSMSKKEKQAARKEAMAKRSVVDKVCAKFVNNGFQQKFGRRLAQFLHLKHCAEELSTFEQGGFLKTAAEGFTKDFVCHLGEMQSGAEGSLQAYIQTMLTNAKGPIDKKRESIGKVMTRKGWRGGMGNIDTPVGDHEFDLGYGAAGDDLGGLGAVPRLVGIKGNCWRWGPNESPMPGLPLVIVPLGRPLLVTIFEAKAILTMGLSISDIRELLESASGLDFMRDAAVTTEVESGQGLYIPMGYIAQITYQYERKQDFRISP